MHRFLFFLILSMAMAGCTHRDKGQLMLVEKDPQKGFQFPYYLYIPEGISADQQATIIVEPNNSGFASDDFNEHLEKAKRTAAKDFYIGNYVSRQLKYPLLVPVFPRPESEWKIYTHALDRDVILQKDNPLERIDLQLIAMIRDAREKLNEMKYITREKVLMTGFSASGTFANRFTLIHPERIMATAAGGLNGLLMLPVAQLEGKELDYPLGVHDFELQFGQPFDSASFKSIPQLLFMGELDDNDAIPFEDGYEPFEKELIFSVLGEQMQPLRWNKCREVYHHEHVNARVVTYPHIGHEHPDKVKEDILDFFKTSLAADEANND